MALQQPDIVLLDLSCPTAAAWSCSTTPSCCANAEVVLITGHASLETSIQALRLGAADYLVKPVSLKQLQGILSRVMRPSALKAEAGDTGVASWSRNGHFGAPVGHARRRCSASTSRSSRVAGTAVTVFITGESGTGKELVARPCTT